MPQTEQQLADTPSEGAIMSHQQMASKYALAILNRRPADTSPDWLLWANEDLAEFYRYVEHAEFRSNDGLEIHYAVFENRELPILSDAQAGDDPLNQPTDQFVARLAEGHEHEAEPNRGWVFIAPGRVESYLKYQEITLELVAAGYSVAMIDHRGQGHSDRLTDHHQQGHVDRFNDYARDFAEWVQLLQPRIGDAPAYILAHSMGGAIAALYLQTYAGSDEYPFNPFQKAAFSAPMCGIKTKPFPFWVAKPLTKALASINGILAPRKQWYAPTTGDYVTLPFAENELTHSENRYQWFSQMYHEFPKIKVGGPTNQWVAEAIAAARQVVLNAQRIKIPVLVLQGSEDAIVAAEPQQQFVTALVHSASKLVPVAGARHEILMESDAIRERALKHILQFLRAQ
ncbi:MAG: alpha/beta fold hydrolase [Idiomarina sp.]|nr:alpha/beta fold hydrolase [Idiomarina sp.]